MPIITGSWWNYFEVPNNMCDAWTFTLSSTGPANVLRSGLHKWTWKASERPVRGSQPSAALAITTYWNPRTRYNMWRKQTVEILASKAPRSIHMQPSATTYSVLSLPWLSLFTIQNRALILKCERCSSFSAVASSSLIGKNINTFSLPLSHPSCPSFSPNSSPHILIRLWTRSTMIRFKLLKITLEPRCHPAGSAEGDKLRAFTLQKL